METKKTTKANLEKTKTMNFLMSVIVALSIIFVSFEWKSDVTVYDYIPEIIEDDPFSIPITEPDPAPEPPAPPAKVEIPEILVEVPDDVDDDGPVNVGTEPTDEPLPSMQPNFGDIDDGGGETPTDDIFVIVETMPKFPGGDAAMMSFIAQSIKYPVTAIERGLDGKVICSFVIDKDGSITDVEVVRGIDVSLDKEALRVIGLMPKWSPGMQRDKAVRVKYTLPINFRLQK